MAVLPIIKIGHPNLRKRAEEIREITDEVRILAQNMIESMRLAEGIGLAANQVNELKRLFVIDLNLIDENLEARAYINPRLIEKDSQDKMEEGCLSIPEIRADVIRPAKIRVEYQNLEGQIIQEEMEGLAARVFQHELDHLDGVLFIDRFPPLQRKMLEPKIQKIMEEYSLI